MQYFLFMSRKCWLIVLCLFGPIRDYAQVGGRMSDVGYTQIGIYHATPTQALLAGTNQALLPQYKTLTATAYGEKRFLLDDLSHFGLGFIFPVKEGAFGLQASSFGSAEHSKSNVGLSYGRRFSNRLQVGVQFNYLHYHISGYGNAGTVNAEAGFFYHVSEAVKAGLHIYNPTAQSFYGLKEEAVPRVVSLGVGYAPTSTFYSSITLIKESKQALNVQAALQYNILQNLLVKGGVTTANSQFSFGAGYGLGAILLETFASVHPQLGVSPGIMITYKKQD